MWCVSSSEWSIANGTSPHTQGFQSIGSSPRLSAATWKAHPSVPDGPLTVAGIAQPVRIAGAAYGPAHEEQWAEPARLVDFFDVKRDVENLQRQAQSYFNFLLNRPLTTPIEPATVPTTTTEDEAALELLWTRALDRRPELGRLEQLKEASAAQVHAGRLRGYCVTRAQRQPTFPGLPAIGEVVKGFESTAWFGVFAPAQLSPELTDRLNAAIRGALDDPKLRAQFESEGATPAGMSAADFGSFVRGDVARWAPIVRQSGARSD